MALPSDGHVFWLYEVSFIFFVEISIQDYIMLTWCNLKHLLRLLLHTLVVWNWPLVRSFFVFWLGMHCWDFKRKLHVHCNVSTTEAAGGNLHLHGAFLILANKMHFSRITQQDSITCVGQFISAAETAQACHNDRYFQWKNCAEFALLCHIYCSNVCCLGPLPREKNTVNRKKTNTHDQNALFTHLTVSIITGKPLSPLTVTLELLCLFMHV